jgi:outer membrane protein assembly factor BamB
VHVLDAATGETIRVLDGTAATEEILLHNGVLYLMTNDKPNMYPETTRFGRNDWRGQKKWIRAVDPETGGHLWDHETPVALLSFAVTNRGVFFHDGKQIQCLALKTGEPLWQSESVLLDEVIPTSNTPTLVPYDDVVLFIGGKDHGDYRGASGHYVSQNLRTFSAVSADTGKILWSYKVPPTGFECPKDILVVDNLVWIGAIFQGQNSGAFTGRDLHTGDVVREFKPPWDIYWFHQRCFRSKATERFIIPARTGTEFVSPTDGWTSYNHWVRGACLYGSMPANGLLYQPPHPCGCYMESLLHGFNALAPARDPQEALGASVDVVRLEKGPAYDCAQQESPAAGDDWPTFRHDAQRSGSSAGAISAKLETSWKTGVGSTLTAVTIAGGKVFVADKDRHLIHALDAATGKPAWRFTTGGRVDSPPTIVAGRVLFGCRDGYVYCLDAADGQLVWRRRVAPNDRRLVASEQIESLWPVHGSVLVVDGRVYCVAGRSMFLDGGVRLLVLDAKTGEKIAENTMNDVDPTSGKSLQLKMQDRNMPVAAADILSYDGKRIYMKSQSFSLDGEREDVRTTRDARDQTGERAHLFAPAGFLDDTAFHRVLMMYGKTFTGGAGSNHAAPKSAPAGKMLVFDESRVYGFSRLPHLHRWVRHLEFHIYAADKHRSISAGANEPVRSEVKGKPRRRPRPASREPEHVHAHSENETQLARLRGSLTSTAVNYRWSNHDPAMFGRAMVLAGETLFVAGPPAIRNEDTEDALQRWQGSQGGVLWALSREDGAKLAEYELPAGPVFDGMAAAYGRLYVALADGSVVCLRQPHNE